MKIITALLCAAILIFSLAACNNTELSESHQEQQISNTTEKPNIPNTTEPTTEPMAPTETPDTPGTTEPTTHPTPDTSHSTSVEEPIQSEQVVDCQVDLEAIKKIAQEYYSDTVFEVISMELIRQTDKEIVFSVCVSKGGVVQEPNRTIFLEFNDEKWEVTNEGY